MCCTHFTRERRRRQNDECVCVACLCGCVNTLLLWIVCVVFIEYIHRRLFFFLLHTCTNHKFHLIQIEPHKIEVFFFYSFRFIFVTISKTTTKTNVNKNKANRSSEKVCENSKENNKKGKKTEKKKIINVVVLQIECWVWRWTGVKKIYKSNPNRIAYFRF